MATPIPVNRASFTTESVIAATGASIETGPSGACSGVVTDSRAEVAGKLFVTLSGERFDAHRFIPDVLARGAWGVVAEREVPGADAKHLFLVPCALRALGELARAHRQRWSGKVVTIGGSAGKTTTRAATSTLLEAIRPGRIHGTIGNLNNLIGVPMTLLGLEPQHEVAVVELGTNQRGEVSRLAAICQADAAVLTCIGLEHAQGLGDLDGVEAEEADLFTAMRPGSYVIGNVDDARVRRLLSSSSERGSAVCSYGEGLDATHRILSRQTLGLDRSRVRILRSLGDAKDEISLTTRLLGLPGALASAAALAVHDAVFGPTRDASRFEHALDRDVGEESRLKIIERSDRALFIDDCYNANPASMRSSIAVAKELAKARQARLCFVLGDMLELGDLSRREHEALADELGDAAEIVAVGSEMAALVTRSSQQGLPVTQFSSSAEAAEYVREQSRAGDVWLIKGSRGIRLERVVAVALGGKDIAP
ncbi:MAG TPA: UDP-N-acetylmuramoyl-tripeptide--D-alanyl-D-alanine ligase [Polyangiaceae bacterium]|nr:UDP-N-acetylmuramoyl-tripeptide--D-alanyl-D-alanine ligase [Polyangiaceae bacterium]